MKVIFLDIDGPMKPVRAYWLERNMVDYGGFDELSVAAINRIYKKTGAGVVFNSTWNTVGEAYMKHMAKEQGIEAPIYGVTDYPHLNDRLLAIQKWLADNEGVELWCALDDCRIEDDRAILVDPDTGISPDNYREATKHLGNEDSFIVLI